jgi:hypothetical protein
MAELGAASEMNNNGAIPAAAETVQLSSSAGQYRPGGTSNYNAGTAEHVEIATRPSSPSSPASTTPFPATTSPVPLAPAPDSAATGTPRAY